MRRRSLLLAWIAVAALAVALRAPSLRAGRPYINYVDEGNFLHPVAAMLRRGGWDQGWYLYPSLPGTIVAAAARAWEPIHRATHGGTGLLDRLTRPNRYDVLEPFGFLLTARVMSLLASLGVVALTGVFAARLAGAGFGVVGALFAAVAPPLVIRSGMASVDPYAALVTTACLYLTHRSRDAPAPGRYALAAGAAAGCAFAAKYPAVLVLVAFAVTTLLARPGWREAARRLLLAGAGALGGAVVAMPAILRRPGEVWAAVLEQGKRYVEYSSPPVWRQALQRAEWDLPYEHPELGALWLAAIVAGFVVALRDRRLAPTAWGWLAYAIVSVVLLATRGFQAFRNLVPLVPIGCLTLVVLVAWLRGRFRRPLWAAVAAVLVGVAAVPLTGYAAGRARLVDPRTAAVDWLARRAGPRHSTVVLHELVVLPSELRRIPGVAVERRWPQAQAAARARRPRFLVTGVLGQLQGPPLDTATDPAIAERYALRARFGDEPTPFHIQWWHGNRQIVYVLERRGRPPAVNRRGSPSTRHRRSTPSGAPGHRRRRRRAPSSR